MSRPGRVPLLVATLLTAVIALAGCSAGSVTQTDTALSGAPGAFGQIGDILMRDMSLDAGPQQVVPAAPQATVALLGTLVNQGGATDRLVNVTSPYAQAVEVEGPTTIPAGNALRLVGTQAGPVGPSPADLRQPATARLVLRGITQVLRPGPTYEVNLTFERAGQVTVPVIVTGTGPAAG